MTILKIHRTHPNVSLPKFATEQSACFDLSYNNAGKHEYTGFNKRNKSYTRYFANDEFHISPGERTMVPTGLIFDIPKGYSVRIHPRSGLSLKNGIVLANLEGVIDSDYVEEIFVLLTNTSENDITLHNGDRIAQAELVKVEDYTIQESINAPNQKTDRNGGMGSTGITTISEGQTNITIGKRYHDAITSNLKEVEKRGRGRPKGSGIKNVVKIGTKQSETEDN